MFSKLLEINQVSLLVYAKTFRNVLKTNKTAFVDIITKILFVADYVIWCHRMVQIAYISYICIYHPELSL